MQNVRGGGVVYIGTYSKHSHPGTIRIQYNIQL